MKPGFDFVLGWDRRWSWISHLIVSRKNIFSMFTEHYLYLLVIYSFYLQPSHFNRSFKTRKGGNQRTAQHWILSWRGKWKPSGIWWIVIWPLSTKLSEISSQRLSWTLWSIRLVFLLRYILKVWGHIHLSTNFGAPLNQITTLELKQDEGHS